MLVKQLRHVCVARIAAAARPYELDQYFNVWKSIFVNVRRVNNALSVIAQTNSWMIDPRVACGVWFSYAHLKRRLVRALKFVPTRDSELFLAVLRSWKVWSGEAANSKLEVPKLTVVSPSSRDHATPRPPPMPEEPPLETRDGLSRNSSASSLRSAVSTGSRNSMNKESSSSKMDRVVRDALQKAKPATSTMPTVARVGVVNSAGTLYKVGDSQITVKAVADQIMMRKGTGWVPIAHYFAANRISSPRGSIQGSSANTPPTLTPSSSARTLTVPGASTPRNMGKRSTASSNSGLLAAAAAAASKRASLTVPSNAASSWAATAQKRRSGV